MQGTFLTTISGWLAHHPADGTNRVNDRESEDIKPSPGRFDFSAIEGAFPVLIGVAQGFILDCVIPGTGFFLYGSALIGIMSALGRRVK